jgi:hypothetical protein
VETNTHKIMETSSTFLQEKITERIKQWENSSQRMESGYAYEKTFVEMWQSLGREVMQNSMGELPKSRNSKKKFKPAWENLK